VNDRVKALLKELGDAINEAVTGSVRVESIMQAIRDNGYDAYLMLEANIAVQDKRLSSEDTEQEAALSEEWFTDDDRRFLKRLRIES
jgi:sugar phosphate isomerase/epimerase